MTFSTEHIGACAASPRAVRHRCGYTLRPNGGLLAENVFDVDEAVPDLPRLDIVLASRGGLENLRWFGRGPRENYVDRRRTSLVDLYADTVTGQYVPYVLPQEHGNHTNVRWLTLDDGAAGLRVRAVDGGPLEFSASHHTADDLFAARPAGNNRDWLGEPSLPWRRPAATAGSEGWFHASHTGGSSCVSIFLSARRAAISPTSARNFSSVSG